MPRFYMSFFRLTVAESNMAPLISSRIFYLWAKRNNWADCGPEVNCAARKLGFQIHCLSLSSEQGQDNVEYIRVKYVCW